MSTLAEYSRGVLVSKSEIELRQALDAYADRKDFELTNELGSGTDGLVYATTNDTAVKVFLREKNFWNEIKCYWRFRERGITKIDDCNIPTLVARNIQLRVVEIDIVKPPFVLVLPRCKSRKHCFQRF